MKKTLKKGGCLIKPRVAPEPNKQQQSQQETYKPSTQTQQWARKVSAKKVSEEGWVKKGDFKRPTSTIYHASGAFRPGADIFEQRFSWASRSCRPRFRQPGSGRAPGSSTPGRPADFSGFRRNRISCGKTNDFYGFWSLKTHAFRTQSPTPA